MAQFIQAKLRNYVERLLSDDIQIKEAVASFTFAKLNISPTNAISENIPEFAVILTVETVRDIQLLPLKFVTDFAASINSKSGWTVNAQLSAEFQWKLSTILISNLKLRTASSTFTTAGADTKTTTNRRMGVRSRAGKLITSIITDIMDIPLLSRIRTRIVKSVNRVKDTIERDTGNYSYNVDDDEELRFD